MAASAALARLGAIAFDSNRPADAVRLGELALPDVLGWHPAAPDLRVRLFINLAKGCWQIGRDRDVAAYIDAAEVTASHARIGPGLRAHIHLVKGLVAADVGDAAAAIAETGLAMELAVRTRNTAVQSACRQNLGSAWLAAMRPDLSEAWIRPVLDAPRRDEDIVELLAIGVHSALAMEDGDLATERCQRLLHGYMSAPSELSPLALGYMFEVVGDYLAFAGRSRPASAMWHESGRWFGLWGRARDRERVNGRVADHRRRRRTIPQAPEVLYLRHLALAIQLGRVADGARQLAISVNRLLGHVAPAVAPSPAEHAAYLQWLAPEARGFAAEVPAGRAAARILSGEDARGRAGLDVLSAYHRLADAGVPWARMIHHMQESHLDPETIAALDDVYRAAVV